MSNSKSGGWVRHRGGKCPVDKGVRVDVRYRSGMVNEHVKALESVHPGGSVGLSAVTWEHYGSIHDIMAYKLHKPAEQVEACSKPELKINLPEGYGEIYNAHAVEQGPLQWRDRITEIDATTQALTTERAELVQKLASEGFALIGRVVEPVEDMSDWRNWKIGDRLVLTASGLDDCEKGEMLTIDGLDFDDDNQPIGAQNDNGKHHWPIIKAGHFETLTWHSRPSA